MAERQQVWVTWSGSKLLHKSRLRVDLLGGVLSLEQRESQDGSTGNLSAHLPSTRLEFGSSSRAQPCAGPSSPSRGGSELALPCCFPAEDLRAFYHTWRSAMTPAFQIGPDPYVTQG